MASVFLSYDRDDADPARHFAQALESAGHEVWWDLHVRGGAQFSKVIEEALKAAEVVVVLWSRNSIESAWVRDEAAAGRDTGRLVPVAIDGTEPPLGFRQFHTIDLSRWKGRGTPSELKNLLADVESMARSGAQVEATSAPVRPAEPTSQRRIRLAWAISAAAALAVLTPLLFWRPWTSDPSGTVAVSAADSSSASREYARDLLAQLGQLQSARPDTLQLVGGNQRGRASLIFEVAGETEGQQARANLVLLDGRSGSLLWSKPFVRPLQQVGDLRQELGYTAAQVLDCATDIRGRGARLKTETLRLYLRGCAGLAGDDPKTELIAIFKQVVRVSPRLDGAWEKLLMADADRFAATGEGADADRLRQDIAAARRINPNLAQAYLGEILLVPPNAYGQQISLADHAVRLAPDRPEPLVARALALFSVGRVNEAVDDAHRAAQLDPVSPRTRDSYITILADAGRTDTALRELKDSERLWPGTSDSWTRFRINMRYGDPNAAAEVIRSGSLPAGWAQAQSFLQARANPTQENIKTAIDDAWRAYRREPWSDAHLVQTLAQFGKTDELIKFLSEAPLNQATEVVQYTFEPMFRGFWHDPRSFGYAKRVGLLQYWQSSGKWPDFCGDADLPYDCKAEAAKLQ